MLRRIPAAVLIAFAAAPVLAQQAPPASPPVEAPRPATQRVALETSEGVIVVELETERAPITAGNFLRYVDNHRFDGITFYRVVKVAEGYGLVQGGPRNEPRRMYPPIAHEPTTTTGLTHVDGAISMGRATPGTAAGDFFFTVGAIPAMDAHPDQPGDNAGYAAFGHVVEGMDVLRRILDMPTSATEGPPGMQGQMLAAPVRIVTAKRVTP